MRKNHLTLALEQSFAPTAELTYSEEGFKDLFRKIYDKWKEWFPTTYWTLEGAKNGLIKKTDQLRAFGKIGNDYADMIAGGLIANEAALNALSSSFKSKRPLVSTARYLGEVNRFIAKINNRGRMQRGRFNLELAELAIEGRDEKIKEFIDQATRFGNLTLLRKYEEAVELAQLAIRQGREGLVIAAGLNAKAFSVSVEKLPLENFDTDMYLRTYNPSNSFQISFQDLERKVLSEYYTPLFETLRFFVDSRAYSRVLGLLWALDMYDYEAEDHEDRTDRARRENFLRLVLELFGVGFEDAIKVVTKQVQNSYVAMLAFRCQCSDYMTLHRLLLQAQIAYAEETIRRLRDADPQTISQEAFDESLYQQPLSVPGTYSFGKTTVKVEPEPSSFEGNVPSEENYRPLPKRQKGEQVLANAFQEQLRASLANANNPLSLEGVEVLDAVAKRLFAGIFSAEAAGEASNDDPMDVVVETARDEIELVVDEYEKEPCFQPVYSAFSDAFTKTLDFTQTYRANLGFDTPDMKIGDCVEAFSDGTVYPQRDCKQVAECRVGKGCWEFKTQEDGEWFTAPDSDYLESYLNQDNTTVHQYR